MVNIKSDKEYDNDQQRYLVNVCILMKNIAIYRDDYDKTYIESDDEY